MESSTAASCCLEGPAEDKAQSSNRCTGESANKRNMGSIDPGKLASAAHSVSSSAASAGAQRVMQTCASSASALPTPACSLGGREMEMWIPGGNSKTSAAPNFCCS